MTESRFLAPGGVNVRCGCLRTGLWFALSDIWGYFSMFSLVCISILVSFPRGLQCGYSCWSSLDPDAPPLLMGAVRQYQLRRHGCHNLLQPFKSPLPTRHLQPLPQWSHRFLVVRPDWKPHRRSRGKVMTFSGKTFSCVAIGYPHEGIGHCQESQHLRMSPFSWCETP